MTENEVNIWSDRVPLLEKMRWWSTLMGMQWRRGISTALLIQARGGSRLRWRKTMVVQDCSDSRLLPLTREILPQTPAVAGVWGASSACEDVR